MSVKIRLQRQGRKKRAYYHIVIADSRSKRDGRYIERIGSYNPVTQPAEIKLDSEKALDWLMKGAQPTESARAILKYKGVIYKKHLLRGVKLGVVKEDDVETKFQEWVDTRLSREEAKYEIKRKAEEAARLKEEEAIKAKIEADRQAAAAVEAEEAAKAKAEAEAAAAEEVKTEEAPEANAEESAPEASAEEAPEVKVEESAPEASTEEAPEAKTEEEAPKE
tara:strand:+ start:331 stop:996 length:666 start_codon:yes stop_codon:yes gene_type:complete